MPVRILFISAMPQKNYEYLAQINVEINTIRDDIFEGINIEQHDYVTQVIQYIEQDKITKIFDFEPNIVHFTGHGTNNGLVLQDGDSVSAKWLRTLFENKNGATLSNRSQASRIVAEM